VRCRRVPAVEHSPVCPGMVEGHRARHHKQHSAARFTGNGDGDDPGADDRFQLGVPTHGTVRHLAVAASGWGYPVAGAFLVYGVLEATSVATDPTFGRNRESTQSLAAVPMFVVLALVGLVPATVFLRHFHGESG
jgi:hypothetical protein